MNDKTRKLAILREVDRITESCDNPPLTPVELRNTLLTAMIYGCFISLESKTPYRIIRLLREILEEERNKGK